MTNIVNGLLIALDKDIREDDIESLMNAIGHFKNVIGITKNIVDFPGDWIARTRVRNEFMNHFIEIMKMEK